MSNYREHLYRRHIAPEIECLRCKKEFKDRLALTRHLEAAERCPVRAQDLPDGRIDQATKKRLASRKKVRMADADKWKDTYSILFPGEEIPEPCRYSQTT